MQETRYALEIPLSGTLDSNGSLTLQIGPVIAGEHWVIRRYPCQATSGVTLDLYRNYISAATNFDHTLKGNNDNGALQQEIQNGEQVIAVWTNGQPNTTVTVTLIGDRMIPGRRSY